MPLKNQVNFGHILTILSVIIVPLLIWGGSVESMKKDVQSNTSNIKEVKGDAKSIKIDMKNNHTEVMKELHLIQLELKDKKDR